MYYSVLSHVKTPSSPKGITRLFMRWNSRLQSIAFFCIKQKTFFELGEGEKIHTERLGGWKLRAFQV